ncbi:MAG: hypothetical protein RR497_00555 [Oscillospiraceae bacterium]
MTERTSYRVQQVIMRTEKMKKHKERLFTANLLSASFVLTSCLVLMFSLINFEFQSNVTVSNLYGAVLLYENAGGYVLAGIIAFILGIVITVLCLHSKNKK